MCLENMKDSIDTLLELKHKFRNIPGYRVNRKIVQYIKKE